MEAQELRVLVIRPRILLHARVEMATPTTHALLVRAALEVARNLGPSLAVFLVQLREL